MDTIKIKKYIFSIIANYAISIAVGFIGSILYWYIIGFTANFVLNNMGMGELGGVYAFALLYLISVPIIFSLFYHVALSRLTFIGSKKDVLSEAELQKANHFLKLFSTSFLVVSVLIILSFVAYFYTSYTGW